MPTLIRRIGCAVVLLLASGAWAEPFSGASDPVILQVARLLPAGWSLASGGGELALRRRKPVWVLDTNLVNAPASTESDADRARRIQKHGREVKPAIIFKMEWRWKEQRLAEARAHNAALGKKLVALGKKHRVDHLLSAAAHRKHPDPAFGATAEERKRLAAYQAEVARLEATRIRLPDYHTESRSLFFDRHEGWSDAHHLVHPAAAAEECYRVDRKVREALLPSR